MNRDPLLNRRDLAERWGITTTGAALRLCSVPHATTTQTIRDGYKGTRGRFGKLHKGPETLYWRLSVIRSIEAEKGWRVYA